MLDAKGSTVAPADQRHIINGDPELALPLVFVVRGFHEFGPQLFGNILYCFPQVGFHSQVLLLNEDAQALDLWKENVSHSARALCSLLQPPLLKASNWITS